MKLTAKLITVVFMGVVLVAILNAYITINREHREFEQDAAMDAHRLGEALDDLILAIWETDGVGGVLTLIRTARIEEYESKVRWVWFDGSDAESAPMCPPEQMSPRLIDQRLTIEVLHTDGQRFLHTYWPVAVEGNRRGGLEIWRPMTRWEQIRRQVVTRTMFQIGLSAVLIGLFLSMAGINLIGRPLNRLTEKTRRIAQGDLTGPIDLATTDELGELGQSLNEMCDRLAASQASVQQEAAGRVRAVEQLRHADRLRTVGNLAAGVAHELGTPLNVVAGRAEMIAKGKLSADDVVESAQTIKSEADRMTGIIRQLLDFARRRPLQRTPADLAEVVRQVTDFLTPLASKKGVQIVVETSGAPCDVTVDVNQIQQVITNLTMNAIQSMPDGGDVGIHLDRTKRQAPDDVESSAEQFVALQITDRGTGIPESDLERVFEPFFTTKQVGEGTGLGLSISYGIVREHGGWIEAESNEGQGSRFTVYLPADV